MSKRLKRKASGEDLSLSDLQNDALVKWSIRRKGKEIEKGDER